MACKHENKYLMGTKDGILCRNCGQLFPSFVDIHPADVPDPEQVTDHETAPADPAPVEPPKRGRKKKGE